MFYVHRLVGRDARTTLRARSVQFTELVIYISLRTINAYITTIKKFQAKNF